MDKALNDAVIQHPVLCILGLSLEVAVAMFIWWVIFEADKLVDDATETFVMLAGQFVLLALWLMGIMPSVMQIIRGG